MRNTIIILFLGLAACNGVDVAPNSILLYGHGGEGFSDQNTLFAPNSVGSIQRALDFYDLDGVEVDIQFTKDEKLIVFHDDFLENTTQCKGKVSSTEFIDIQNCYFKKQFYNTYSQSIIGLDSLISLINNDYQSRYFSLNVRIDNERLDIVDTLAIRLNNQLSDLINLDKISVECNDANFLFFLKRIKPEYQCLLVADIDSSNVEDVFRFELDGVVSFFENRDNELEKRLNENSKAIVLYGQKTSRHYSNYDYTYISGVQVDNPALAVRFFRREE